MHKGQHNSPNTEFKKHQHPSVKTEFKKGNIPWTKIHGHSDKTKKKISEANKGKKRKGFKLSEEHKIKIIESRKKFYLTHNYPNKGKKLSRQHRKALSKAQYKFYATHKSSNIGRVRSQETRDKISLVQKGKKLSNKTKQKISKALRGENAPSWMGGITKLKTLIRHTFKYRQWRSRVFQRDNWTCQTCHKRGCYLEAHHIKAFAKIIKDNNIKTIEAAIACQELWAIDNGVTLCKDCHNLTKRKTKGG
jgi:Rps23 Pro-64 3,4-dihydroxylase Tpa1-like proline 4-hydroxylase